MFKVFTVDTNDKNNNEIQMDGQYNQQCMIDEFEGRIEKTIDVIGIQFYDEIDFDYSRPFFWTKDTPEYQNAMKNVKQEHYFSSGQHCGTFTDLNEVKQKIKNRYETYIITYNQTKLLIAQFKVRNTDCHYKTSMLEKQPTSIYLFDKNVERLVKVEGEDFFTDDEMSTFNESVKNAIVTVNQFESLI